MASFSRVLVPACLLFVGSSTATAQHEECSTVVAMGLATVDGRPLLWKNRDTDDLHDRVIFVDEKPFSYLALVDDNDTSGRVAWTGVNAAGFAICNSVAYNLPGAGPDDRVDLEGMIMADALRSCATVEDFEHYLGSRLGSQLGSRANFCVIDARGGAAIFEVSNRTCKRINAAETTEKYLVNTNFSRTGTPERGSGYLRFERETALLHDAPGGKLSYGYVLQVAARDLCQPLLRTPPREAWKTLPAGTPYFIHTNHTINRPSSAAAVVIRGVLPGEDPGASTMWVILGEPVTSVAVPLWVSAGKTPAVVASGALCTEALRIKGLARPFKIAEKKEYLDLARLDNDAGTGWLPRFLAEEKTVFSETEAFVDGKPTAKQRVDFEGKIAERVMKLLQTVR
jgi:hypothetical protein